MERRAGGNEELRADRRRSRRPGSEGAEDGVRALGPVRHSGVNDEYREGWEDACRGARRQERLEAHRLRWSVSAYRAAPLLLQAPCAQRSPRRPENPHKSGATEGNGGSYPRADGADGDVRALEIGADAGVYVVSTPRIRNPADDPCDSERVTSTH